MLVKVGGGSKKEHKHVQIANNHTDTIGLVFTCLFTKFTLSAAILIIPARRRCRLGFKVSSGASTDSIWRSDYELTCVM